MSSLLTSQQLAVLPLRSDTKVRTWYAALAGPTDPVMDMFLGCIQQRVGRKASLTSGLAARA